MHLVTRSRLIFLLLGLLAASGCDRAPAVGRATNVLLITLDTTRADRLGAYGHRGAITPNLDALAAEGSLFSAATTSVPMTLPAHASLMTGSTPLQHRVKDNSGFILAESARTLAESLGEHGYATRAIVAAYVLHHSRGLAQGFDEYDDRFDDASAGLHTQRNAAAVAELALDRLEDEPARKRFLWLHLYDPHFPYTPPADFAGRLEDPYDGEIAYVDSQLGRIFDYLDRAGLDDSTLIVVAGDHGEAFGEHREVDHGIFLYEPTMRIPLIVRAPGKGLDHDVDDLVRDIDVMPTVLDYLGLPIPDSVQGRSLLPLMSGGRETEPRLAYGETFYSRYHYGWSELTSIRDRRHKFIQAPSPELYDLEEDPLELHNLVDVRPGIAEDLAATLRGWLAESDSASSTTPASMDPESLARLRSLGYAGSSVPVGKGELPDPKNHADSLELFARVGYRASEALRERRYDDVIALVDEALKIEPSYLDGYKLAARAHHGQARHDLTIELLDRALQISPEDIETLNLLAQAHRARGDTETALALWLRIRELSPESPAAYLERAAVLIEIGRLEQARVELDAARVTLPGNPRVLYDSALLRLRRGQLDEASTEIRSALALAPRLPNAHFNLALIAEQRNDAATARSEYLAELDVSPDHLEAWTNLGLLRLRSGDLRSATEAFSRVVELKPDSYVGYYLLARAALAGERVDDEVLALAVKARELDGGSPRTRELVRQVEHRIPR